MSENLFSGTTTVERPPVALSPNTEAKFEIKFQYTDGPYSLSSITAITDITPQGAERFVHFNAEPFDVYQNSIARIPVSISIDPDIEYEKIFLNISYVGTGTNGEQFKSSWFDSLIFDIAPKMSAYTQLPSSEDYEFATLSGARYDGQVEPCYGTLYNGTTIPIQCDYRHSCGVIPFDNDVYYQPPLKQFKSGIHFEDIKCRESLSLAAKYDGSPACTTHDTRTKLIEYGWATNTLYKMDDEQIIENVERLSEVKMFLAKYPYPDYVIDRDSWNVSYSINGVISKNQDLDESRTKKILIEIDSFGRPVYVGIECGGPVTLSAQSNVIELLNTPN